MKNQKNIFIVIGVFCLFALIAGIYEQVMTKNSKDNNMQSSTTIIENEEKPKNQEEIKEQLTSLFTNEFYNNGMYDTSRIIKANNEKDIIYSAYDIQEQKENYEIDVHLPVINIKGDVVNGFNNTTQTIFVEKTSSIRKNEYTEKVIYSVDYVAYINDNVLSLIIKSTLKQGSSPQRIVIQTYNYNLDTGEKVELVDILSNKNIIQSECQSKINEVVSKAQEEAQILLQSGYSVYNRNLSDEMYNISNVSTYFLGKNGEFYIIFAYGNQNFTAEMDVVLYADVNYDPSVMENPTNYE